MIGLVLVLGLSAACLGGPYDKLPDASAEQRNKATQMWSDYVKKLGDKSLDKQVHVLARFFDKVLVAHMTKGELDGQLSKARRMRSTGLLAADKVRALKRDKNGFLLVIDSKAGQVGIPLVERGGDFFLADLALATGDFNQKTKPLPKAKPATPSMLYLEMIVLDEQAPLAERLRSAVAMGQKKNRKRIGKYIRQVRQSVVRLGLGLAKARIEGFSDVFINNFPREPDKMSELAALEPKVFEDMLVSLGQHGANLIDPPANEVLYQLTAAAPDDLKPRFAKALYDMGELNPTSFLDAVHHAGAKKPDEDKTLPAYFAVAQKQPGKAPKVRRFLKKCARALDPDARKMCRALQSRLAKNTR